jgi:3-oxoacyl-[acyl-carrier-protein] synthase II
MGCPSRDRRQRRAPPVHPASDRSHWAVTLLKTGQLDLVVAGGYDTISEYAYAGFNSLRLVAEGPLRPFARGREGMKLAEGYGIVVLERAADAHKRGARALATVLGWGESADAHHLTQPHPEGDGAARAISRAIKSAGLSPGDIDLVAAHATGTPDNDAGEYAALRRVFGQVLCSVPVVGFKSHLGHTLGGAGACELILSALALRDQVIPACANASANDTEFEGLCLSSKTQRGKVRATLNTSLGFGGANTCIVLGPPPQPAKTVSFRAQRGISSDQTLGQRESPPSEILRFAQDDNLGASQTGDDQAEVFITGIGLLLPGVSSPRALAQAVEKKRTLTDDAGPVPEDQFIHLLNARRVRRMSDYVKLTLAATALALADAGIQDVTAFAESCSVVLGSTHGSTNYSTTYYRQIVQEGIAAANPMLFAEGVPNAAAAHLSLMLSLKGACQTIIGSRTSGLDALRLASLRIASGEWDRALVGAAEEYDPIVNACYRSCARFADGRGFVTGAAAVTFVLESRKSFEKRRTKPRARVSGGASARATSGEPPIDAARHVLSELGDVGPVFSSANGTWIDRVEAAAIAKSKPALGVHSLYGPVPETFSAGPLLAIAAALTPRAADNGSAGSPFGVLCTDYTGVVSGAAIAPMDR